MYVDVGLAEKYKQSNGTLEAYTAEQKFASMGAMQNTPQCRLDDIESLYYVLAYLAGITSPFEEKDPTKLMTAKDQFCIDFPYIVG